MNEIDAWLACDSHGLAQAIFVGQKPIEVRGRYVRADSGYWITETHGYDIQPGQCRPVRLRVEVVECKP